MHQLLSLPAKGHVFVRFLRDFMSDRPDLKMPLVISGVHRYKHAVVSSRALRRRSCYSVEYDSYALKNTTMTVKTTRPLRKLIRDWSPKTAPKAPAVSSKAGVPSTRKHRVPSAIAAAIAAGTTAQKRTQAAKEEELFGSDSDDDDDAP